MNQFPWQILLDWYSKNGRHDYPWRWYSRENRRSKIENRDTIPSHYSLLTTHDILLYRVWLAEILLQQTQADRVVPFYERILERYPTIKDLADSTYDEFFLYYQGLGYYSRARNLLKTANIVSRDHA
jgi:A/G-specific adenine glycosylase